MDCGLPDSSACQAPPSLEFSRQEYWSGLPFPALGSLPNPEMEPTSLASPALSGGFFTSSATWEALFCLWTHGFSFRAMGHNLFLSLLWWSAVPTLTRGRGLRVARIVLIRYGGMYRYDNDHHERRPVSSSWSLDTGGCSRGHLGKHRTGPVRRQRKWGENAGAFIIISTGRNGWGAVGRVRMGWFQPFSRLWAPGTAPPCREPGLGVIQAGE